MSIATFATLVPIGMTATSSPSSASAPNDSIPPSETITTNTVGETFSKDGDWALYPGTRDVVETKPGGDLAASEEPGIGAQPQAVSDVITAGDCDYRQVNDKPHLSRNRTDASIHGWWIDENGKCPDKANVDITLQAYWCDNVFGCQWRTVDTGSSDVRARNAGGKRANARQTCATFETISWRGDVDVDLIGVNDPSGYTRSDISDINCAPPK